MKLLSPRTLHIGVRSKILVEKKCFMNVAPAWSNDEYPKLPGIFAVLCNKTNSFKSTQYFLKNKFKLSG